MASRLERREFLRRAVLAGTALPLAGWPALDAQAREPQRPRGDKLKIGVIGVAARGEANLNGVAGEEIVALCDIDAHRLAAAAKRFPQAKTYDDYRRVIDHQELDAVVVSTPDHMHAFPVVAALAAGHDVYCEKPLAHSVWEVRQIRRWAARQKAVTQMGTQIHAGDNYRRAVEIVQAGLLGPVQRVHVWLGGGMKVFPQVKYQDQPPAYVNYDLWTGPAPLRPFSEDHFHFNWRYWWDYGNGALGDFGCHYMDLPYWALGLRAPVKVAAEGQKGHEGDNDCPLDLKVDYHYPARGDQPGVHLTWYQGKYRPAEFANYGGGKNSAVLFEGPKGRLLSDYSTRRMFFEGDPPAEPQPTIPASAGHHAEFLQAVRERGATTCNFDYSGALAEAVLLGNVSYRVGNKPLEWDDEKLTATNCPEAAQFIRREYRKGWRLDEPPAG